MYKKMFIRATYSPKTETTILTLETQGSDDAVERRLLTSDDVLSVHYTASVIDDMINTAIKLGASKIVINLNYEFSTGV